MQTFTITKDDLDKDNFYIGEADLTDCNGNIETDADLGIIIFKDDIKASGYILFKEGSGFNAYGSVAAGSEIKIGARRSNDNIKPFKVSNNYSLPDVSECVKEFAKLSALKVMKEENSHPYDESYNYIKNRLKKDLKIVGYKLVDDNNS